MGYTVTIERSNGYRCSCHQETWEDDTWCDELDDALYHVPLAYKSGPHTEILKVEVQDGSDSDSEVIAWGKLDWTSSKALGQSYTRWHGHRPDVGDFEYIVDVQGQVVTGRTWDQLLADLRREKAQRDLEEARAVLARAEQVLKNVSG